ncbi:hypothetical protein DXG01_013217, partial [Tephrocybe rancida]
MIFCRFKFDDDIQFIDELHAACRETQADIAAESHVERIPYDRYRNMSGREVGDIFRHKSILVTNVDDAQDQGFEDALRSLGSLRNEIIITDQSVPLLEDDDGKNTKFPERTSTEGEYEGKRFCQSTTRHHRGTLRQILDSLEAENPKSLNCLDIPATSDDIRFHHLFSDKIAWDHTERKAGDNYPLCDMRWSLASSGWTQHRWHQDCNGFATVITVLSGMKWWYVGTPKPDLPPSKQSGGVSRLLDGFDLDKSNSSRLDVE